MLQKTVAVVGLVVLGVVLALLLRPAGPAEARDGADVGRYRVVAGDASYVLYDPLTSVSWVMPVTAGQTRFAWLPTRRINTEADATKWRAIQRVQK